MYIGTCEDHQIIATNQRQQKYQKLLFKFWWNDDVFLWWNHAVATPLHGLGAHQKKKLQQKIQKSVRITELHLDEYPTRSYRE